ncbi:MAG: S8 family serine peptidase [Actinomycetota bacterium]|nr:S8 family serine peptidase [Actinomycetota bacterium]
MSETKAYLLVKTLQPQGAYRQQMHERDSRPIESEVLVDEPGTIIEKAHLTEEEVEDRRSDARPHVLSVEEDAVITEHPVEVVDAEPAEASGYAGSYVTADVLRVMGIDKLYDAGRMGQGETVGVVDTPYHMDSLNRLFGDRLKGSQDFSGDGINGPKGTHGTFCAIYATPPRANLLVASGLGLNGSGRTSGCIAAAQWLADNGATHITASLGSDGTSSAWQAFASKLKERGITFGASAGNDGCSGGDSVGSPGRYADYCTAASDHRTFAPASFSSCGPDVDITAAGVRVQLATGDPELDSRAWSGTSMSCPVDVHGVACVDSGELGRERTLQLVLGKALDTDAPAHREGNGWFNGAAYAAALAAPPAPPAPAPAPSPEPAPAPPGERRELSTWKFCRGSHLYSGQRLRLKNKRGDAWDCEPLPKA